MPPFQSYCSLVVVWLSQNTLIVVVVDALAVVWQLWRHLYATTAIDTCIGNSANTLFQYKYTDVIVPVSRCRCSAICWIFYAFDSFKIRIAFFFKTKLKLFDFLMNVFWWMKNVPNDMKNVIQVFSSENSFDGLTLKKGEHGLIWCIDVCCIKNRTFYISFDGFYSASHNLTNKLAKLDIQMRFRLCVGVWVYAWSCTNSSGAFHVFFSAKRNTKSAHNRSHSQRYSQWIHVFQFYSILSNFLFGHLILK